MDRFLEWAANKTIWFLLLPAFVVCFFSLAVPIYLSTQPGPWQLGGVVAQMPVAAEVGSGDERDELGSG